ncbi:hypothetical protein [Psychrobacter pygoscelis]|uniref:hypothetical protein n=1 Tax=Psychrobacter pygoscelis TaxID=2488563 RepID=UPI0013F3B071|nr:hypothetical protein [Psychrobacter pygoscelis]
MSKSIKFVMGYDCELAEAMVRFTELLPTLVFEQPEINIHWSGRKWIFTAQEGKEKQA